MKSERGLVACAVFVIALAGLQLSLNLARGFDGDDATSTQLARLLSGATHVEQGRQEKDSHITEDSPLWDCATMGNRQCGPGESTTFGTDADPRPLRMAGVEIHKRECPKGKGAKAKLKLLNNSAIYGHCKRGAVAQDEGPKEPREPSTSRGKR